MFTGVNASVKNMAKKNAVKNLDSRLHDYILFYKGEIKSYKESLSLDKRDTPYFYVIDTYGNIVYATDGSYSEDKMYAIEEVLE